MAAGALLGKIKLNNLNPKHLTNVLQQLKKVGCHIEETNNSLIITKADSIKPLNIETEVYPGFPTDLQAQWISIMILANGKSKVTDNVYYDRFSHVPELNRFGRILN